MRPAWLYGQKPPLLRDPTWVHLPTWGAPALTGSSPLHTSTWSISEQSCVPETALSLACFALPLPLGPRPALRDAPPVPPGSFAGTAGAAAGLTRASWRPAWARKPGAWGPLGLAAAGRHGPEFLQSRDGPYAPPGPPGPGNRGLCGSPVLPISVLTEEPLFPAGGSPLSPSPRLTKPGRSGPQTAPLPRWEPECGAGGGGGSVCPALPRGPQGWTRPSLGPWRPALCMDTRPPSASHPDLFCAVREGKGQGLQDSKSHCRRGRGWTRRPQFPWGCLRGHGSALTLTCPRPAGPGAGHGCPSL